MKKAALVVLFSLPIYCRNPCTDPKALRIAIINGDDKDKLSDEYKAGELFKTALEKAFFLSDNWGRRKFNFCFVEDEKALIEVEDSQTPIIEFRTSAIASQSKPIVVAIAVDINVPHGPLYKDSLHIGSVPALILQGSDYDLGAKATIEFYDDMIKAITGKKKDSDNGGDN